VLANVMYRDESEKHLSAINEEADRLVLHFVFITNYTQVMSGCNRKE